MTALQRDGSPIAVECTRVSAPGLLLMPCQTLPKLISIRAIVNCVLQSPSKSPLTWSGALAKPASVCVRWLRGFMYELYDQIKERFTLPLYTIGYVLFRCHLCVELDLNSPSTQPCIKSKSSAISYHQRWQLLTKMPENQCTLRWRAVSSGGQDSAWMLTARPIKPSRIPSSFLNRTFESESDVSHISILQLVDLQMINR